MAFTVLGLIFVIVIPAILAVVALLRLAALQEIKGIYQLRY